MYEGEKSVFNSVVSFAAVIRVVRGEALRDDSNNGCGGDYQPGGSLFKNGRVYTPEISCMKRTSVHIKL